MGMLQEFREFAVKGNVVDLAVGVIIGAAFGKIVDSLVGDLVMPLVGLVVGKLDFSSLFWVLGPVPPSMNTSVPPPCWTMAACSGMTPGAPRRMSQCGALPMRMRCLPSPEIMGEPRRW